MMVDGSIKRLVDLSGISFRSLCIRIFVAREYGCFLGYLHFVDFPSLFSSVLSSELSLISKLSIPSNTFHNHQAEPLKRSSVTVFEISEH